MAFHLLGLWPPPILEARKLHWTAREPWSAQKSAQAPALWAWPGGSSCFLRWNDCSNRSVRCQDQWSGQELQCWSFTKKIRQPQGLHKRIQTCITIFQYKKQGVGKNIWDNKCWQSRQTFPLLLKKLPVWLGRCEKIPWRLILIQMAHQAENCCSIVGHVSWEKIHKERHLVIPNFIDTCLFPTRRQSSTWQIDPRCKWFHPTSDRGASSFRVRKKIATPQDPL